MNEIKREGIKVAGHRGTWYVIVETAYKGAPLFLLEHETHGEDADHIVINAEGTLVMEGVVGGVVEVLERMAEDEPKRWVFEDEQTGGYSAFTTAHGLGQNLLDDALTACETDEQASSLTAYYKGAKESTWLSLIRDYGYKHLVADAVNISAWEGYHNMKWEGGAQ